MAETVTEALKDGWDDYLFSRKMQPGRAKEYPTRAAELWKDLVQDELELRKPPTCLSIPGPHFIAANPGEEDLKWLQTQMSYSDLQTTSIYTNKLKTVKLDESKANSPEI